jgi:flagellar biosynthesis/type III secretory pathway M-ring protein FliF/YscJ
MPRSSSSSSIDMSKPLKSCSVFVLALLLLLFVGALEARDKSDEEEDEDDEEEEDDAETEEDVADEARGDSAVNEDEEDGDGPL